MYSNLKVISNCRLNWIPVIEKNITESLNKPPHAHTHQKHGIFTAPTAEMKQMYSTHITGE